MKTKYTMVERLRRMAVDSANRNRPDEYGFLNVVADKIEASPEVSPLDPSHHNVMLLIATLREVTLKLAEQHKCTCRRGV